ncbi:MAG: type II toxin-antitoxin system VapC family toxin [Geminicoccaceae bacterium]
MMVVDSSAIVAVFLDEPEAGAMTDLLRVADEARMSAANLAECHIVLDNRTGDDNGELLRAMLFEFGIAIEPVTAGDAWLAAHAYRRFGRGHHRAKLNYGDCFAYALARSLDAPLLFKGDDFRHTDIEAVL